MSWLGGYKSSAAKEAEARKQEAEARETKRKELEAARLSRAKQRSDRQKQLQAAIESRREADQALQELQELDPSIFEGESGTPGEISLEILEDEMPEDEVVVDFEDENGADDARALQEACRSLERFQWDHDDLSFTFNQLETSMASVGAKKQYTKFRVLSQILPKKYIDQLKPVLRKKETEFQGNAYKILKNEILRIFGPRPEAAIDRALNRVMVDTPSQLARELANDICKHNLECDCCPAVVMSLWKRHLPGQVRAGIAHCNLSKATFDATTQLADDIWSANRPSASVAAITTPVPSSLDETQPALPYPTPEVSAIRSGRGRGGNRGRGRGRGGRNNGQASGGQASSGQASGGQASRHKGARHPDLPAGEWSGCQMHFRWGRGAFFCSEPGTCPWKNVFAPKK